MQRAFFPCCLSSPRGRELTPRSTWPCHPGVPLTYRSSRAVVLSSGTEWKGKCLCLAVELQTLRGPTCRHEAQTYRAAILTKMRENEVLVGAKGICTSDLFHSLAFLPECSEGLSDASLPIFPCAGKPWVRVDRTSQDALEDSTWLPRAPAPFLTLSPPSSHE